MTGPVKGQQLPQGRTRCVSSNSYRTDGHTDRQDGGWTGSWVDRRVGGREGGRVRQSAGRWHTDRDGTHMHG